MLNREEKLMKRKKPRDENITWMEIEKYKIVVKIKLMKDENWMNK